MNRATTTRTDGTTTERRTAKRLSREARGLVFVYVLFALVSGALAFQCVERSDPTTPRMPAPASSR